MRLDIWGQIQYQYAPRFKLNSFRISSLCTEWKSNINK